jgi:hypothetical protein
LAWIRGAGVHLDLFFAYGAGEPVRTGAFERIGQGNAFSTIQTWVGLTGNGRNFLLTKLTGIAFRAFAIGKAVGGDAANPSVDTGVGAAWILRELRFAQCARPSFEAVTQRACICVLARASIETWIGVTWPRFLFVLAIRALVSIKAVTWCCTCFVHQALAIILTRIG